MVRYLAFVQGLRAVARTIDRHLALEMLTLWLAETVLTCFVIYCLLLNGQTILQPDQLVDVVIMGKALTSALVISLVSVAIGLYRADICLGRGKFVVTTLIASLLLAPAIIGLSRVFGWDLDPHSPLSLLKIFAGWLGCLAFTRVAFHLARRSDVFARKVLVIGSSQHARRIQNIINASGSSFCRVVGVLPPDALALGGDALRARRLWSIVIADEPGRASRLPIPATPSVRVFDEAAFCENRLQRLDTDRLPADWDRVVAASSAGRGYDVAHRAIDLTVSVALLVFTLPLMVLTAVAIKLETRGSVFYSQERVGREGRVFMLRKFRSMTVDAERAGAPVWAARNDPRVTRVGRFIRSTRIDELPQLLNVLSGEMSFIGPRPERPHFVKQLASLVPHYADRACVKPGITGWAQVRFPYGASIDDARMKLAYDLYYVKHRSVFFDLLIMVLTVRVILFQEGSR